MRQEGAFDSNSGFRKGLCAVHIPKTNFIVKCSYAYFKNNKFTVDLNLAFRLLP